MVNAKIARNPGAFVGGLPEPFSGDTPSPESRFRLASHPKPADLMQGGRRVVGLTGKSWNHIFNELADWNAALRHTALFSTPDFSP